MIRGTTASFKIKLPYTISELEWITVKWWQDGNNGTPIAPLPITKRLAHCSVSNIYVCKLSSEVVAGESYYFEIDKVNYGFTATQDINVGEVLKYDTKTEKITVGKSSIIPKVIDNLDNKTGLVFVNDTNNSKELYVTLTAAETMRFSDKYKAKMQLRGKLLSSGRVFGCKHRLLPVYPINDDLLSDDVNVSTDNSEWVIFDGTTIDDVDDNAWVIIDGKTVASD